MHWLRVNITLRDTTNIMSHRRLELYDNWRCLDKNQAVVGTAMCTACDTCRTHVRTGFQRSGLANKAGWKFLVGAVEQCNMDRGMAYLACQHSRHLKDTFQSAGDASKQAFLPEHIVIALAGPVV